MKTGRNKWYVALSIITLALAVGFAPPPAAALTSISLQWSANTELDLAGYRIKYWLYPSGSATVIDVKNVTTYTLAGLPDGRYYFSGQAYDTLGQDSPWSDPPYLTPAIPKTMGGLKVMRIELAK